MKGGPTSWGSPQERVVFTKDQKGGKDQEGGLCKMGGPKRVPRGQKGGLRGGGPEKDPRGLSLQED